MQLLAMITMLIDHIGIVFAPGHEAWRIVGRLAFPIYAYCLTVGYQRTSSRLKYVQRLAIIAIVSQLPYTLALGYLQINVVGTFVVCLLVLWAVDALSTNSRRQKDRQNNLDESDKNIQAKGFDRIALLIPVAAGVVLLESVPFDYGGYALLLILAYWRIRKGGKLIAAHMALNVLYLLAYGWILQLFSVFATVLIVYAPQLLRLLDRINIKRWLWRSFYPAHLAALAVLAIIIK